MGWNHQDECMEGRHLRAHFSQDKTNLGGESLTHKSHKNCVEFLYSNFNLSIHEVGLPIYRFRSLEKEEKMVDWEGTKYDATRCLKKRPPSAPTSLTCPYMITSDRDTHLLLHSLTKE